MLNFERARRHVMRAIAREIQPDDAVVDVERPGAQIDGLVHETQRPEGAEDLGDPLRRSGGIDRIMALRLRNRPHGPIAAEVPVGNFGNYEQNPDEICRARRLDSPRHHRHKGDKQNFGGDSRCTCLPQPIGRSWPTPPRMSAIDLPLWMSGRSPHGRSGVRWSWQRLSGDRQPPGPGDP